MFNSDQNSPRKTPINVLRIHLKSLDLFIDCVDMSNNSRTERPKDRIVDKLRFKSKD